MAGRHHRQRLYVSLCQRAGAAGSGAETDGGSIIPSGETASGNATANANAVTIDNQWGYVNARVAQSSSAQVNADSYVTIGGDFLG